MGNPTPKSNCVTPTPTVPSVPVVTPTPTPTPVHTCKDLPYQSGGPVIEPCGWTGPPAWPTGVKPPHIGGHTCTDLPIHVGGPVIEPCNFPPKGYNHSKPGGHPKPVKVVPVVVKHTTKVAKATKVAPVTHSNATTTKTVLVASSAKPVVPSHALANTGSEVIGTAILGVALILSGVILSIKGKNNVIVRRH